MSETNLLKLDRVQYKAKRVLQAATRDTHTETVRFLTKTWSRSKHTSVLSKIPTAHSVKL